MNNRLESLRIFYTAAAAANFREAAQRLAVSPQVVTRAVRELEDELGESLFHRSTRGVRLTDFGAALAERARVAVGGVDQLFQRIDRRTLSQHAGTVRVAAPGVLGRQHIPRMLAPMLTEHPGLVLDLRLSNRLADVVGEKIDVGVRVGPLRDSRFVAKPLGTMSLYTVAAPSLLARVGAPASVAELEKQPLTALIDPNSGRPYTWDFSRDRKFTPATPVFVTDDHDAECAAVVAGLAFGQIVAPLADPWIASGQLVRVLERHDPTPWPVYVYRVQRSPVPARVRLVYDALIEVLR
ncbi:LysR family transcriptional regulator [Paucibacter sp. R3-3]|uniref:LysR family transcriptional regulator n=1 Tax=Roseateles agri TaxID=3098619 RepID=A0ABU5DBQ5_9BURK|nr:LysR family transcriptional regulator [Paucibacter sp. R3-3]MDY0743704.1 LysR family transcriptional regulator [Paucibacter sp. R3-3]